MLFKARPVRELNFMNNWIKIEDELPDIFEKVIVCFEPASPIMERYRYIITYRITDANPTFTDSKYGFRLLHNCKIVAFHRFEKYVESNFVTAN